MLLLKNLRATRMSFKLSQHAAAILAGIDDERYKRLELVAPSNGRKPVEAWFSEAARLASIFDLSNIGRLITPLWAPVSTWAGLRAPSILDVKLFRSGEDMALSCAACAARALGLDDPLDLIRPPRHLMLQLWDTMRHSERTPFPGPCPWCAVMPGVDHLPTCLPEMLFSPRNDKTLSANAHDTASRPTRGLQDTTSRAYGLKKIRTDNGLTQSDMARIINVTSDYYSKMERAEQGISASRAETFAAFFKIPVVRIYAKTEEQLIADANKRMEARERDPNYIKVDFDVPVGKFDPNA